MKAKIEQGIIFHLQVNFPMGGTIFYHLTAIRRERLLNARDETKEIARKALILN